MYKLLKSRGCVCKPSWIFSQRSHSQINVHIPTRMSQAVSCFCLLVFCFLIIFGILPYFFGFVSGLQNLHVLCIPMQNIRKLISPFCDEATCAPLICMLTLVVYEET